MRTTMMRSWAAVLICAVLAISASAAIPTPSNYNFKLDGFVRLTSPTTVTKCSIAVGGNYAAVLVDGVQNMLYGVDVTTPSQPRQVCAISVKQSMYSRNRLFMKGPHAFVGHDKLQASIYSPNLRIDLSESTPTKRLLRIFGVMLAVQGNTLAYNQSNMRGPVIQSTYNQFNVGLVDISDPVNPVGISSFNVPQETTTATLVGRVLLTNWATIDFSSSATPFYNASSIWRYPYAGVMGSIGVRGAPSFRFESLVRGNVPMGTYAFPPASAVAVDGGMAYVAVGSELYAVDITDPGAPGFIRGYYQLPGSRFAMTAAGGRVYVYDVESHTVTVLRYTGEEPVFTTKPDSAELAGASIPLTAVAGEVTTVTLTMRNNGLGAWGDSLNYRLGVDDPAKLVNPYSRIPIAAGKVIAPGQNYTFNVPITGPVGHYKIRFRMVHEFVTWFGPAVEMELEITPAGVILHSVKKR